MTDSTIAQHVERQLASLARRYAAGGMSRLLYDAHVRMIHEWAAEQRASKLPAGVELVGK